MWLTQHISALTRTGPVCVWGRPSGWSAGSDQTDRSPPLLSARCFLSPGAPLAEQSDSPSASGPHVTSWQPHCSSLSWHSMTGPRELYKYLEVEKWQTSPLIPSNTLVNHLFSTIFKYILWRYKYISIMKDKPVCSVCTPPSDVTRITLLESFMNNFRLFLIIGCGRNSSNSKLLCLGSNSRPGTVARERSSAENSVSSSNLFLFSSFSLSSFALLDSW